jgi:hyperosmotically inducible protein
MYKSKKELEIFAVMLFTLLLLGAPGQSIAQELGNTSAALLKQEISHQLAALPYYDVFDNITFIVSAKGNVVLSGDVTRSNLKRDAEAAVENVKGVQTIVNNIEVLPRSPVDDSIRWEAFKAIFEKPGLQKYATQTTDPLRIIVKNREIILDGAVANRYDRKMIDDCARSVMEASGVIDNLVVRS